MNGEKKTKIKRIDVTQNQSNVQIICVFCDYEVVFPHTNMYLKFFVVERFKEMLGNELTESFLQCQELGFNTTHEPPGHIKPEKT